MLGDIIVTNLTLPKGGKEVQEAEAPVGCLGASLPPRPSPFLEGFSGARRGTIKCNFTAASQAGKERFFCVSQIKIFFLTGRKILASWYFANHSDIV